MRFMVYTLVLVCLYVPKNWICVKRDPAKNCCIKIQPMTFYPLEL
jgi:hypothetical protein